MYYTTLFSSTRKRIIFSDKVPNVYVTEQPHPKPYRNISECLLFWKWTEIFPDLRKKQFILFLSSQSAKNGHQNLFIDSV